MSLTPGILARGPWPIDHVRTRWLEDAYVASPESEAAADAEIAALRDRDSPSHDGLAARMVSYDAGDRLELELQPMRWSLRLLPEAEGSISVHCVVRDGDGRWLAGRRAAWVATWAGRWTLGAGGAVEVGENPAETLTRELEEEWSLVPDQVQLDALLCLPNRLILLVGQATVPAGAEVVRDPEHDDHAWWPADPDDWPDEAETPLRMMAKLVS